MGEETENKKVGRPLKFETVEEMQAKIDEYFETAIKGEYTITGLALALDTTRLTLIHYEEKDEFLNTIKKAKTRIENDYETSLRKTGRSGDIFGLKNFGWKDKTEVEESSPGGGPVKRIYEIRTINANNDSSNTDT